MSSVKCFEHISAAYELPAEVEETSYTKLPNSFVRLVEFRELRFFGFPHHDVPGIQPKYDNIESHNLAIICLSGHDRESNMEKLC